MEYVYPSRCSTTTSHSLLTLPTLSANFLQLISFSYRRLQRSFFAMNVSCQHDTVFWTFCIGIFNDKIKQTNQNQLWLEVRSWQELIHYQQKLQPKKRISKDFFRCQEVAAEVLAEWLVMQVRLAELFGYVARCYYKHVCIYICMYL